MLALYRKELRTLAPFLLLSLFFLSGDIFYRPFKERLDEATWESIASYVSAGEDGIFGWYLIIIALFVAYAAFPREHDERTIHFLYALPVRRSSIFVAKVLGGLTILWIGAGQLFLTDAAQSVWDTQSFSGGHWRLDLALTHLALQMLFFFVAYSHALLASVLRLFGLLPYVLLLMVAAIVEDVYPPAVWISPSSLLTARYAGTELVVSWVPWGAHLGVAVMALLSSYLLWMGPADQVGASFARARASIFGKLAAGCGTVFVVLGVLTLAVIVSEVSESEEEEIPHEELEFPSFETEERETARYHFTYPVSHRARAVALMDVADELHAGVAEQLGADEGPSLLADLTEVSGDHLGIASWTHLRVGIVNERDPIRLRHTFAHETVHAFQHRLSDRRQGDEARAAHFFAEGSAEYIAYLVAPNEPAHRQARVVAAASWERHRMRTDDLFDEERFGERFDTILSYALGERWSAALVESCGPGAVGDVLRAMGRPDAPRDLSPRAFWESTLRAAGCDLESVDATFATLMEAEAEMLRDSIEVFPRIGGGVSGHDGGSVRVVALLDREADPAWTYLLRVRADPSADDSNVVSIRGRLDPDDPRRVRFRVSRALIPSRRFQLLLSVMDDPRGWPFSETWQWATAP